MKFLFRHVYHALLFFILSLILVLVTDKFLLQNILVRKSIEYSLNSSTQSVHIDKIDINYMKGIVKMQGVNINFKKLVISSINIKEAICKIALKKKSFAGLILEIDILNSTIQNSLDINSICSNLDSDYSFVGKIIDHWDLLNRNHVGSIINQKKEKIYFDFSKKVFNLKTKSFTFNNIALSGDLHLDYITSGKNKGEIKKLSSSGSINNFKDCTINIKDLLKQKFSIMYFPFDLSVCNIEKGDWKISVAYDKKCSTQLETNLVLSNIRAYQGKNLYKFGSHAINVKSRDNIITCDADLLKLGKMVKKNSLHCVYNSNSGLLTLDLDQYIFMQYLSKQCDYDQRLSFFKGLIDYLNSIKNEKRITLSCNLKNDSHSISIEGILKNYFSNFFPFFCRSKYDKNVHLCCDAKIASDYVDFSLYSSDQNVRVDINSKLEDSSCNSVGQITIHNWATLPINKSTRFADGSGLCKGKIKFNFQVKKSKNNDFVINSNTKFDDLIISYKDIKLDKKVSYPCAIDCKLKCTSADIKHAVLLFRVKNQTRATVHFDSHNSGKENISCVINHENNDYRVNLVNLPNLIQCDIEGAKMDLSGIDLIRLIDTILVQKKINLKMNINDVIMQNDKKFSDLVLDSTLKKDTIISFDLSCNFEKDGSLKIKTDKKHSNCNSQITKLILDTNNFGYVLEGFGAKDVVEKGSLNMVIESQIQEGNLMYFSGYFNAKSFYIPSVPLLKIFSPLTFIPSMIINPKKTLCRTVKGNFAMENGKITIKDVTGSGTTFSFIISECKIVDGEIESKGYVFPDIILPFFRIIPIPYKMKKKFSLNE